MECRSAYLQDPAAAVNVANSFAKGRERVRARGAVALCNHQRW